MEMITPQSGMTASTPESRYILPSFEERTSYGFKRQDPYAKLFEDRIVFLGVQVDDASADDVMALRHFLTHAGWTSELLPMKEPPPAALAIAVVIDHADV